MTITVRRTDARTLVLTVEAENYEEGSLYELEALLRTGASMHLTLTEPGHMHEPVIAININEQ